MAEVVAILSTSWKLIRAIHDIVERIRQTREDGRALRYLERQAVSFLDTVNQGLVGCDASLYMGTIMSLEGLLRKILQSSTDLAKMSRLTQFRLASKTKQSILDLEKELRFFVDTYLIQTATHSARINLEAMASPRPVPTTDDPPLIPDDLQWEIMSQNNDGSTTIGPSTRIHNWNRGVVNMTIDEVEIMHRVDTEPRPRDPMIMTQPVETPANHSPSDWQLCFDAWLNLVILGPVHVMKCSLDFVGAICCDDGSGCCSNGFEWLFPICASERCIECSRYTMEEDNTCWCCCCCCRS